MSVLLLPIRKFCRIRILLRLPHTPGYWMTVQTAHLHFPLYFLRYSLPATMPDLRLTDNPPGWPRESGSNQIPYH